MFRPSIMFRPLQITNENENHVDTCHIKQNKLPLILLLSPG